MYSTAVAYLLWVISGFGALGFHRFYLGKFGTGVLYFFTGGLAGIGSLYDLFTLPLQVREANTMIRYRGVLSRQLAGATLSTGTASKKESIERVILRTAKKNKGRATASEVALEGDVTIEEAKRDLEKLAAKGFAEMRVTKSGTIVYLFPELAGDGAQADLEDF